MAGPTSRKRYHQDNFSSSKPKSQRPNKKQRKQQQIEYHSDSNSGEEDAGSNPDFKPVNLRDSDNEDLNNIAVDDLPSGSEPRSGSDSDSDSASAFDSETDKEAAKAAIRTKKRNPQQPSAKDAPSPDSEPSASASASEEEDGSGSGEDNSDDDEHSDAGTAAASSSRNHNSSSSNSRSKRNDPSAFATSISKILSTKLSAGRRADPVLARSADAQRAAREVADGALEARARKQMREQRRLAQEKGRVRDVLGGGDHYDANTNTNTNTNAADDNKNKNKNSSGSRGGGQRGEGAGEVQQRERRLRKVAHRGVVVLFRAVREAQERAAQAERDARREGVVGVKSREEKVSEMSRQGFLDLIANGGGKLKKGGLEEA